MKRKLLAILLVVLMGTCSVAFALDIPNATPNFFVNDFAGIFSQRDVEVMMEKAIDLDQNYNGIQVVVTTIKTIGNEELGEYANKMYNKYGIGQDDMGVLLLVVTEDRRVRAETGDMMQTYIPDSLIGKIQDEFATPYLHENKFAEGMVSFQDAVIREIKKRVVVEENDTNVVGAISTEPVEKPFNVSSTVEPVINKTKNATTDVHKSAKETQKSTSGNVGGIIITARVGLGCVIAAFFYSRKETKKFKEFVEREVQQAKSEASENQEKCRWLQIDLDESRADVEKKTEQIEDYIKKLNYRDEQIQKLQRQFNDVSEKYSQTQQELQACQKRLEQARLACPDIDAKIDDWIAEQKRQADMLAAESFDSFAVNWIALPSSIDNLDGFRSVIDKYQALTEEQKAYVKTDMCVINNKYEESVRLKKEEDARLAREAEMREAEELKNKIEQELRREIIPKRDYCEGLELLMKQYNGMSEEARGIFSLALMNEFSRRISNANDAAEEEERRREEEERRRRREEEEERRQEEEERRRRQRAAMSSYSRPRSSSSFGSGSRSSFGGFSGRGGRSSGFSGRGGRSSGGGASGSF